MDYHVQMVLLQELRSIGLDISTYRIGQFNITKTYETEVNLVEKYNPYVKLIVILRDPTNRCISQYKMEMSRGSIEKNSGLWDAFSRMERKISARAQFAD